MINYLLDTDIAIELLRGRNVLVAGSLASKHREQVFLSTVTVAELLFGALRSQRPDQSVALCRQFCSSFQLAELDYEAAERSVLATHNVREFGRVTGLHIEDWMALA